MRKFFAGAPLAAMVVASSSAVQAQETTSAIRGTVTSAGAPVAGAQITATNLPSGTVSRTTSDPSGQFSAAGLRSGGPYKVDVASTAGTSSVTDIFTVVGQPFDLSIEIAGGAEGTDIVVTASSINRAGITSDGPQTTLTSELRVGNRMANACCRRFRHPLELLAASSTRGSSAMSEHGRRLRRQSVRA